MENNIKAKKVINIVHGLTVPDSKKKVKKIVPGIVIKETTNKFHVNSKIPFIWKNAIDEKIQLLKTGLLVALTNSKSDAFKRVIYVMSDFSYGFMKEDIGSNNKYLANIDTFITNSSLSIEEKSELFVYLCRLAKMVDIYARFEEYKEKAR